MKRLAAITTISDVISISNADASLALKSDGTVWSWGLNNFGQLGDGTTTSHSSPAIITGLSSIIAVSSGGGVCLALKNDGTVWSWVERDTLHVMTEDMIFR